MDRMKALVIVTLLCLPQARAQSTNASPDLTRTDAPFDPAKSASLPEPAKAAVTQAEKQMKSGALAGFIFAASPDLKVWTLKAAPKTTSDFSRADLARTTLEACDFNADQPCKILSVDGYDTRQKAGGWPKQPDALIQRPGDFEFVSPTFCSRCGTSEGGGVSESGRPSRLRIDDGRRMAVAGRNDHRPGDRQNAGRLRRAVQGRALHPLCGQQSRRVRLALMGRRQARLPTPPRPPRRTGSPGSALPRSRGS